MKYLIARMRYNTFVRLKASFPARRNESMSSYFNRLSVHLEWAEKNGYLIVAKNKDVRRYNNGKNNKLQGM